MRIRSYIPYIMGVSLLALSAFPAGADETPKSIPPPAVDNPLAAGAPQTAVLAGGCYWGMQEVFEHVKGVNQVVAGMSGFPAPSGADDILGRGQVPAEAVQVTFDPARISYGQILRIYFSVAHDPTEVNRQGPDRGPRYRSEILYGDDSQEKIAEAYVAQLEKAAVFHTSIATDVSALRIFHSVPASQQDYAIKHPSLAYIVTYDLPKLAAFKTLYPDLYAETPVTMPE